MHLAEGILPLPWAGFWFLFALPFAWVGARSLAALRRRTPYARPLVAMVAAVVFLLSCMPIPVPIAGSCSHTCGTGLAAILIGPFLTVVVSLVALFVQALLMAHGGFTTLGADLTSMGIAGAFAGYAIFRLLEPRLGTGPAAFAAGVLSDWATYAATAFQLALALHGQTSFLAAWGTLILAFAPTQVPLGILEGALAWGALRFLRQRRPDILASLGALGA